VISIHYPAVRGQQLPVAARKMIVYYRTLADSGALIIWGRPQGRDF
jgi:hypothetical protein